MSEETGSISSEDRFLGVRTTITAPKETSDDSQGEMFDKIEVNVIDDTPEDDQGRDVASYDHGGEIKKTKESAQDRISRLTAKFHAERRAKEKADRLSNEAITYTQGLHTENQRLLRLVQDSQNALTERSKHGAEAVVAMATENFKKAHESGDADKIAEAQHSLTDAQLSQASAPAVSQQVIDNWKSNVMAEERDARKARPFGGEPYTDLGPSVPPEPEALEWQEKNQGWFGPDEEMTSLAYGVHTKLVKQGVDPNKPEYYELIDKRMREKFPEYFGDSDKVISGESVVVDAAPRRKVSPVVAPAARNSGVTPRKVTLTSTQVSLSKRLGITPQQYAEQLIKEGSVSA